jgi:hypothetical protein
MDLLRRLAVTASFGRAKMAAALETQKPFVECKEFKYVVEGWIFRAPVPWYFGLRPHYLANEAQKERIASILAASQVVTALLLLPLVVFLALPSVLPSIVPNPNDRFPLMLTVWLLFCLLTNFLTNLYNCFALRSSLSLLPRAAEKITRADRLRRSVPYSSVMIMILMFVICLFGIFEGIRLMLTESVYWSASLAAVVWAGIYIAAVLWIRLKDRFNG